MKRGWQRWRVCRVFVHAGIGFGHTCVRGSSAVCIYSFYRVSGHGRTGLLRILRERSHIVMRARWNIVGASTYYRYSWLAREGLGWDRDAGPSYVPVYPDSARCDRICVFSEGSV